MKQQDCAALRRFTHADDFESTVMFLASTASRQISGHDLTIDGGWGV